MISIHGAQFVAMHMATVTGDGDEVGQKKPLPFGHGSAG
jgi:hypothetical protein